MDPLYRKSHQRLKVPFGLAPSGVQGYYKEREQFRILPLFTSPMVLIGLFAFGAMFILPKLQPQLSPEEIAAIKEEGGIAAKFLGGAADDGKDAGIVRAASKQRVEL